jgi:hypothetical protein
LTNCWRPIFLVLPKLDGCQVDLPNCWSCSSDLGMVLHSHKFESLRSWPCTFFFSE